MRRAERKCSGWPNSRREASAVECELNVQHAKGSERKRAAAGQVARDNRVFDVSGGTLKNIN
jgi:hypothetical protein